ncbi:WxL domain-containing protein, partial [Enterococcus faecalis]
MKQIKFKQLATFGLCCSLLVNSLTGVTAVAETVTIESSPTAESTKESPKEHTETSETTTETSREETTQETEKPEKVKEAAQVEVEQEETETSEDNQPHSVPLPASGVGVRAGNLETIFPQLEALFRFKKYYTTSAPITLPAVTVGLDLVSDSEENIVISDFSLTSLVEHMYVSNNTPTFRNSDPIIVPSATGFDVTIPSATIRWDIYMAEQRTLKAANLTVPKYIENVSVSSPKGGMVGFSYSSENMITTSGEFTAIKSSDGSYRIEQPLVAGYIPEGLFQFYKYWGNVTIPSTSAIQTFVVLPPEDLKLKLVHKKVTENFKDVNGTAIPAPTDFTQGKQTSITNNDYTFTQGGTLPELYTVDGKTYRFKGWYKGKTKPSTLATSKTPSYKVTYDDNDDLNVVYEEIAAYGFPEETFQFGFVNEAGQLVDPDDITITYDYSRYLTYNGNIVDWDGLDLNQKAVTDGKLKTITMPKSSMPLYAGAGQAMGEAMINTSFSLPKYYTGLNIYNKSGKIDSNYPLPSRRYYYNTQIITGVTPDTWFTLAKVADNSYVLKDGLTNPNLIYSSFPMTRRFVGGGVSYYYSLDAPVYYHLTQRKVTENFVDAKGAEITPPTGFTQGKQTMIDSDPYTFKQSGTLPETYKANGKTYQFKGWYKGKTKPATLETSKPPSYKVTYDDNDDLNVVYEEADTFEFPALTYQFGFVDESGQRVDASTIGLTYDNWYGELLTDNVADWQTITLEKGQVAPTKNNLKEITYPAQALERVA